MTRQTGTRSKKKSAWKPAITYADPPWDLAEKHDEMIAVLLTGRLPLGELQDFLDIRPTKTEKKAAGKYGHVSGLTRIIRHARLNGWPIMVSSINHESWVWLPQHIIDEFDNQVGV